MSFIILSTGRSGSGYTAKVLTNAGIPTGHEISYNLEGNTRTDFMGESSWLALPYVEEGVYPSGTTLYHQTRHPLKTIGSLINGEMYKYSAYLEFQTSAVPMLGSENYLDYSARFVLEWNKRIEKLTKIRWAVESFDFNTIQMIAFNQGVELDGDKAALALMGTSKTTNKHPNTVDVQWRDISNVNVRRALKRQALKYGYRI